MLTILPLITGFATAGMIRRTLEESMGPTAGLAVAVVIIAVTVAFGVARIALLSRQDRS